MWRLILALGALVLVALALVLPVPAREMTGQPGLPNRFYGKLTIDGRPAPADTDVRAFIGDKDCTTPREPFPTGFGEYALEVAGGGQISGCGFDTAEITFRVGNRVANERGYFVSGLFTRLDLTITTPTPTPTPAPLPPPPPPPRPAPRPAPPPTPPRFTLARLDLTTEPSLCIPSVGETACDEFRLSLWSGEIAAWRDERARQGLPEPAPEEIPALAREFRVAAGDPTTFAAVAREMGWPKLYITAVRFRGEVAGEADEYVEITNAGGGAQDMTGWRVRAVESGVDFFFAEGAVLEPGAYCRFYTAETQVDSCPGTTNVSSEGVWNPDAGTAELWHDPLELLADRTRYSADPDAQPPPPNLRGVRPSPD